MYCQDICFHSGDGKLGYIAVCDYNPTKLFTFQGREYPPAVELDGENSGPDSAMPRASIIPRPSDAGEEDENDGDGGDGNNGGSNNNKKKQNLLGLVMDGEEAARLQKRVETEKADVRYILVSRLPANYRKLVQGLLCSCAMWQAIEGHFGTRDPTDYASSYMGVFRYRLEDAENPEMFVQTLDSNIITFERVIDTKLSDIFESMILQHALPTLWEYIVRGWLGQAKTLSYIKLMELVSAELKRRRPEGSGQDKGIGEKAYAAVEAKPIGGIVERKCFACKKAATSLLTAPRTRTGARRSTPPSLRRRSRTRASSTTRKTPKDMITVIVTTKATRTDIVTTDVLPHVDIQVVSGPVVTVVLTKVIVVVMVTVEMMTSGVYLLVTDHGHPIMAVSQEGTGMEDLHPHTLTSHVDLGTIHPHLVTSGTTAPSRRGLMIVDINHNHLPGHPSTELHVDRHRTTVIIMVRLSSLVVNVDHHLGVDIRRHVGGRIASRHEDALVHEEDNTISMAVAILMNDVVVHVIVMVFDHHIEGTLLEALTFQKEVDTKGPNPVGKQTESMVEGLKFLNTTLVQGEQQETLKNLENQLREDMQKREEDKAVATSGSVEEDNAVATSDPTTMLGEAVADPEHKDDQASTAVAVSASAEKPALGLVSATSSLNTNELTWVIGADATSHMCKDIDLFVAFEPLASSMETAANPLRILGKGTVGFPVKVLPMLCAQWSSRT
ncbi:unnamed protein product [Phytophthora fragariaefolia]|uniref:Unnamed protein product n=1 Tax=Phytophthora fragariaefolia TaxID=1490495 RepID=A0A9W6XMT5_9STRA|nr:unnamed protein product [Phytophthora fragariaefolia]